MSKKSPINIVMSSLILENIGYIILLLFFGILYSLDSFQTYQNVFIMGSNIILKHMEGVFFMFLSGKLSSLNFFNPFYIVFQICYVNKFETNLMYIVPKNTFKGV